MRRRKQRQNNQLPGCLIWIALAIFFLPIVLIPMWIFKRDWSVKKKAIISVIILLGWGLFIGFAYSGEEQTADPVTVQSVSAPITTQAPTEEPTAAPVPTEIPVPTQEPTPEPTTTPTPAPSAVPVLKSGAKGEQVKQMQERLIALLYLTGKADGDFGPGTKQAVKDFQSRNGLQADGIAGQQTLEAMFAPFAREQEWVCIPAERPSEGKEKYHDNPDCSKMNNPLTVTIEDAKARGFDACGKCY